MRIHQALLGLAALCVVALTTSGAQTSQGNTACAEAPRNGDGDRRLEALCDAIHKIAEGAQETTVTYREDSSAQVAEIRLPAEIKLWRNENGTAIDIDFGGRWIGASVIARLLSGSVFVPTTRIDLLVVHNARIEGVLDLSNATIELATRFANVRFNPQKDGKCGTGEPAVKLISTHAKKRISLLHSQVCGFLINGSQLDGGIQIAGTDLSSEAGDTTRRDSTLSNLFIIKSTVESDLLIMWTRVNGNFVIERSSLSSISIVDTDFRGPTAIVDNTIGALSSWDTSFNDSMQVANNHVEAELKLAAATFQSSSPPAIRDNLVEGSLEITIRELHKNMGVDLQLNKVGRASDVWLPENWQGVLKLENTEFQSVLSLCLARYDLHEETLMPVGAKETEPREEKCPSDGPPKIDDGSRVGLARETSADEHLPPSDKTDHAVIDLKSAQLATLVWRLPLDCSFRWEGTGLRYQNWGEGSNSEVASSESEEYQCRNVSGPGGTDGLMLMRYVMAADDVDTLDTMADYLASRGEVVESREIRQAAKKANYDVPANDWEDWGFEGWSRAIAGQVLRPVGYGAKPELALIWLGFLWLISYAIYEAYSLTLRRSWQREIKADDDKVKGYSSVPGFLQFDKEKDPKDFEIIRYSIDAMLPVINLHTYDRYYPRSRALRVYSGVQHAVGWFLITIFLVSAAIL